MYRFHLDIEYCQLHASFVSIYLCLFGIELQTVSSGIVSLNRFCDVVISYFVTFLSYLINFVKDVC
jgi:hypothetical protein